MSLKVISYEDRMDITKEDHMLRNSFIRALISRSPFINKLEPEGILIKNDDKQMLFIKSAGGLIDAFILDDTYAEVEAITEAVKEESITMDDISDLIAHPSFVKIHGYYEDFQNVLPDMATLFVFYDYSYFDLSGKKKSPSSRKTEASFAWNPIHSNYAWGIDPAHPNTDFSYTPLSKADWESSVTSSVSASSSGYSNWIGQAPSSLDNVLMEIEQVYEQPYSKGNLYRLQNTFNDRLIGYTTNQPMVGEYYKSVNSGMLLKIKAVLNYSDDLMMYQVELESKQKD